MNIFLSMKVNENKTLIVKCGSTSNVDLNYLNGSVWRDVKIVKKSKYLGVLFGEVSLKDVYDEAWKKFLKGFSMWSRHSLSIASRIKVLNCYLLPLFSFLNQFFILPRELAMPIKNICIYFVWGYKYSNYKSLVYLPEIFSCNFVTKKHLKNAQIRSPHRVSRKKNPLRPRPQVPRHQPPKGMRHQLRPILQMPEGFRRQGR